MPRAGTLEAIPKKISDGSQPDRGGICGEQLVHTGDLRGYQKKIPERKKSHTWGRGV